MCFFMLYLANRYRIDGRLCRFAAWSYYLVGAAGAIYSVVSVPLHLGGVYNGIRMRGFNNEGGSYGTYIMTLIFLDYGHAEVKAGSRGVPPY